MMIGYARISTDDQELALQRDALTAAGCERLFEDTISGATVERPQLAEALDFARAGDTLVVWKLDRLGRSLSNLIELLNDLSARGSVRVATYQPANGKLAAPRTENGLVEVVTLPLMTSEGPIACTVDCAGQAQRSPTARYPSTSHLAQWQPAAKVGEAVGI